MTTLFTPEARPTRVESSGAIVALYALTGLLWLGLSIANFHDGRHTDRAWIQAITATLSLFTAAVHLSRWLKAWRAV